MWRILFGLKLSSHWCFYSLTWVSSINLIIVLVHPIPVKRYWEIFIVLYYFVMVVVNSFDSLPRIKWFQSISICWIEADGDDAIWCLSRYARWKPSVKIVWVLLVFLTELKTFWNSVFSHLFSLLIRDTWGSDHGRATHRVVGNRDISFGCQSFWS